MCGQHSYQTNVAKLLPGTLFKLDIHGTAAMQVFKKRLNSAFGNCDITRSFLPVQDSCATHVTLAILMLAVLTSPWETGNHLIHNNKRTQSTWTYSSEAITTPPVLDCFLCIDLLWAGGVSTYPRNDLPKRPWSGNCHASTREDTSHED